MGQLTSSGPRGRGAGDSSRRRGLFITPLLFLLVTCAGTGAAAQEQGQAARPPQPHVTIGFTDADIPLPTPTPATATAAAVAESPSKTAGARPSSPRLRPTLYSPVDYRRLGPAQQNYYAELEAAINESAARHRIDPLLIWALVRQESGGRRTALSPKGALGPMQLMPGTAARFGVKDRTNVRESVRGGVEYLAWLLDLFDNDVALALAGYNAGEGAVLKYGRRIPPYAETQNYVRSIAAIYGGYRSGYLKPTSLVEARQPAGIPPAAKGQPGNSASPLKAPTDSK